MADDQKDKKNSLDEKATEIATKLTAQTPEDIAPGQSGEKATDVKASPLDVKKPEETGKVEPEDVAKDTVEQTKNYTNATTPQEDTDWEKKYNETYKQLSELQKKYASRFAGFDIQDIKPSEALKKSGALAQDATIEGLFTDSGSKDAAKRAASGTVDSHEAPHYQQPDHQSTAPIYYSNTPGQPQTGANTDTQSYMKDQAGSTAGTPAETDFSDLFEDVKKKGIQW